ncbi:hypothetical protein Rifp1Sym_bv00270 [endosymbiont of Riftia pachyptila (vent Ph05)]|uniref:Uncharacterized protein n=1 Tax=endosymbiont of Riftia pachyptila (vent Ph05) TaxID=1048808 RepID=G2DE55_9GAMM|nr:hypothetical protein Rifp1Sym_bv00270 [endosymbiont of Riftia pachyptila (vent Ph05)]
MDGRLEVTTPVFRAMVAAAVVLALVALSEDATGAFGVAARAAHIAALGLFRVVVEGPFEAEIEAIVEVQADFGEPNLDLLQRDFQQVVADAEVGWRDRLDAVDAFYVSQQQCGSLRLLGVRVQLDEVDLPVLGEFWAPRLHGN